MCEGDGLGHGGASWSKCQKPGKSARGRYVRYYAAIERYISERIGCSQDAEDLAQEALLTVSKRQPENPEAYILAVANNLVSRYRQDQLRRRRAAAKLAAAGLDLVTGAEGSKPVSVKQLRRLITRRNVGMSARLREAFELRFIERLSCEEAAQRLGCSKWALYKRLQRAKKALTARR
jgi:RNA polymerase sigma factor (sigma-70 family)